MNIFESLENLNVSESCFNSILDLVEEEISQKDIKGARGRKLARLETIGKSLKKKHQRAQDEFQRAQQAEEIAKRILDPRSQRAVSYIMKGQEVPKILQDRCNRKSADWQQARANTEAAEKKVSAAREEELKNLRMQAQIYGA